MITLTPNGIIYQALRDLGCAFPGGGPGADVQSDCFQALNLMLDSWLLDELMVFTTRIDQYNLTGGQQAYTIGPTGANFTAPRPTRIENANIILNTVNPVVRLPLKLISDDEWSSIRVQNIPFAIPLKLYYDGGFDPTSGFASIFLWPGPLASYQLELFTWQQLQSFVSPTQGYNFPPGYARAVIKNLAVEIWPMMRIYYKLGKLIGLPPELDPALIEAARQSKGEIQGYNSPIAELVCDPAFSNGRGGGAFNYATGEAAKRR